MILVVDAATKESKQFGDKIIWGIKDKNGVWYDFHGGFKPTKGQSLNVKVWAVNSKNGKEYLHADLMEPPPSSQQFSQAQNIHKLAEGIGNGGKPQPAKENAPTVTPGPSNGKIKWDDWVQIAQAAHDLAVRMEPEPGTGSDATAARLAFVNTTLIAFSQGKLELPTEAGPVSDIQITNNTFTDSDAYANPDEVLPWGNKHGS